MRRMPADQRVVVRGDHHGGAQPVHLLEQLHQPLGLHVVQVAGRFIGQQQVGPADHRARDRHPLLLAAGQFRRPRARLLRQPHPAQHLAHVGADLAFRPAGDAQRQRHVVERRQVRQQAEVLEHHADAPAQPRQQPALGGLDVGAEQRQPAAGRPDRQVHQPQQAGLAGARRPEQPAERAVRQHEAEIVQHLWSRPGISALAGSAVPEPHSVEIAPSAPFLPFRAPRRHCFATSAPAPLGAMRIVCPSCSAAYDVPDSLVTAGRVVRCARCAHEWAPVEAIAPPPEPPPPPAAVDQPPAPPSLATDAPTMQVVATARQSAMDRLAADPAWPQKSMHLRLAWAATIAVLAVGAAAAYTLRSDIVAAWPPSARAYAAFGLHPQTETR